MSNSEQQAYGAALGNIAVLCILVSAALSLCGLTEWAICMLGASAAAGAVGYEIFKGGGG